MSMLTEIKRPEIGPNADELTSLTRGRGPRRGNLEELLKYWRPIMKKPGGFRRCVVILMDKPQFGGKPQRICAWLHHEITGKWPNEGKGKRGRGRGGKRRSRSVRRVRSTARRAKSAQLLSHNEIVEVSPLRIAVRESRDFGGVLVQPIAGRQSAVDMKAAMFAMYTAKVPVNGEVSEKRVGVFGSSSRAGQAAQAAGTIILPGDISDIRSPIRSQIYETLTPGGGRGLPSGRRLIRGAGRTGRGARNKFRCPPGFQKGGTFTNAQFSTCGAQILGIPGKGVGSPSSGAQRALAALARDASLVREIGDLRSNRNPYDIIRAAQIPVAPKKGSPTRRQISINTVLARADEQDFSVRAVRRDGVILEPVVSLQALGKLDEFDDLADGTLIDRYESGQIGKDIVPAFSTGLRDIYVDIPESGAVRVSRVGGELSPTEVESLRRVFPTSLRRAADLPDPSAAIRNYADGTDGRLTVEFGELKNNKFEVSASKNELIRVQTAGGKSLTVPRWVYETFLSRSAPRRAKDAPVYEIMSEGKTSNPFFLSTKTITSLTHRTANYHELIEVRAAIFAANRENIQVKRIGGGARRAGGRSRALFDPGLNRYRCPPGTRYGGRITDQFGRNCGYSLPRTVVNSLVDLGIRIEDAMEKRRQRRLERGSRRERLGAAIKEKYDNALNGLADVMDKLANVLDKTEDKRPGKIGPSIAERRNAAQLTDEDRDLLSGEPLADALDNLKNVLDDQDFQNPDIPEIQKAYKAVEKAAGLEAGRLTDNPAKNEKDRSIGRRILDAIANIMDRLADFVDPDTSRRDRRERRPAASAAPKPSAPKKFDEARKPKNLDNFSQLSIGGRRKKVDVPELRDLSDDDKGKLDNAVQAEFNDLSGFWANRLGKGINDFSEKDIRKYLKVNKNSGNARVERRRYNDWLELNELKRAQDDGSFDGDYEDFVGRLAPNRRDSIVSSIKPPEDPPGDAGDAAGAVDIETPADELPSPGVDYSSQGFVKARGSTPTNEFLMGLSDEDLENYKQAHIAEIAALEAAGDPPSKVLQDRVTAINMIQGARAKQRGVSKQPPTNKDLSTEGFFVERNKFGKPVDNFIKSLTDEELDGYIESFDKKKNDPFEPPPSASMKKARELLGVEREERDAKNKQDALVDNADLEMGDPDPDGFHPASKVEDAVNNPDLNDTTNVPDSIIDESASNVTGVKSTASNYKYVENIYDDEPFNAEQIGKANPATLFDDPDFDINDPKTRVGVLVVDRDTGRVMVRHTKDNFDGYGWTFSKGGIDNGETVHDAAMRELFEETGLSAEDVNVVGALNGSYGGGGGSKNYFFIAQVSNGADKFNIDGNDETDDLVFADPADVASFIDKDTTNTVGKARDLKIAQDLDSWITSGGVTGEKNEKFQTSVINNLDASSSPTKSSGGIPEDTLTPTKHKASLVPNNDMVQKSKQTDLPLKKVATTVDENDNAKREAAAQLLADAGTVDALNDPEFLLTDFDVNDEMFDSISDGSVSRYVEIPIGDQGINGQVGFPTKMFRDEETGNIYVLKKPARNDKEHLSESSAAIVAQDLGLPVPEVTFAGNDYLVSGDAEGPYGQKVTKFGDTTNRPMIIQHVGNVLDMNEGGGSTINHKQMGAMLAQQYLIGEPDNHGANRLNMVDANGKKSVFAFDAGKAFMPHDEKFGEEFFGSKFGESIKNLPAEDRKAIIAETQKALSGFDVEASQKRIRDQVDAGNLTEEEAGRLLEISDFVAQRHGAWKTALGKDFADDALTDDELESELSPSIKMFTPPESSSKFGKIADPNGNPTDPDTYAEGVGPLASKLSISANDVTNIQQSSSQGVVKAMNSPSQINSKDDGGYSPMPVVNEFSLDGPAIQGQKVSFTAGHFVNEGGVNDGEAKFVKNAEFSLNLSPEAHQNLIEQIDSSDIPSYKISDAQETVFHFSGTNSPTLKVDSSIDGTTISKTKFDSAGRTTLSSSYGPGSGNEFIPSDDGLVRVADFGDVKVMVYPEVANGQGGEHGLNRRVRIFVGGDTRESLKDGTATQASIESIFAKIGVDASPPTETQIRDQLARDFLRHATKMDAGKNPSPTYHSGYGTDYDSPETISTALSNLSAFGIKPEDISYSLAGGKAHVTLTPEASKRAATELGKLRAEKLGQSDKHTGNVPKVPWFYSNQNISIGGSDERQKLISRLFIDGSHTGSLDRAEKSQSAIAFSNRSGMSGDTDAATGSGEGMYLRMADHATSGADGSSGVILFSDDMVGKLDAQWADFDVWGNPHSSTPKKWSSTGGPWQHYVNGNQTSTSSNEVYIPHQVPWTESMVNLGDVSSTSLESLESDIRDSNIDLSVLNSRNIIVKSGSGYRFVVWEQGPNGPVMKLGPVVKRAQLPSAKITGKLETFKTADINVSDNTPSTTSTSTFDPDIM
jgi:8-oxo-dGTP pyrophosphatase MutT (NUDIX family)